ncbi:MAG: hypothetical protein KJP00_15100 [Bacteroidia bacterium]|nr:hypothetical protein [Bacteroidia bacterium]
MAKYRMLAPEELQSLEKEFIEFLILNGITSEDWEDLKSKDQKAYIGIIESFSDVVFEKILRKTRFLEFRDKKDIYCIQCLEKKMILVGVKSDGNIDFEQSGIENIINSGLKTYITEKSYKGDRQLEIFQMLQNGYQISGGDLYKKLSVASL